MMTDKDEGEVQRSLGRVEGKLDAVILSLASATVDTKAIEVRIGKLENFKSWIGGSVAVLGMIASYLLAHVSR